MVGLRCLISLEWLSNPLPWTLSLGIPVQSIFRDIRSPTQGGATEQHPRCSNPQFPPRGELIWFHSLIAWVNKDVHLFCPVLNSVALFRLLVCRLPLYYPTHVGWMIYWLLQLLCSTYYTKLCSSWMAVYRGLIRLQDHLLKRIPFWMIDVHIIPG